MSKMPKISKLILISYSLVNIYKRGYSSVTSWNGVFLLRSCSNSEADCYRYSLNIQVGV